MYARRINPFIMFKSRKGEQLGHQRQAKASILKAFGGRFKDVFHTLKKARKASFAGC